MKSPHLLLDWLAALLAALVAMGVLLVLSTAAAFAQDGCGPADRVEAGLASRYGERLLFSGQTYPGGPLIEIYATPDGSTWTAVRVSAGLACGLAAGQAWTGAARPVEGEPS